MPNSKREKVIIFGALIAAMGAGGFYLVNDTDNSASVMSTAKAGELKKLPNGNLQKTVKVAPPPSGNKDKTFDDIAREYVNSAPQNYKGEAIDYLSLTYSYKNAVLNKETATLNAQAAENKYKAEEWNQKFNQLKSDGLKSIESEAIETESGGFSNPGAYSSSGSRPGTIPQMSAKQDKPKYSNSVNLHAFSLLGVMKDLESGDYKAFLDYEGKQFEVGTGYELFGDVSVTVNKKSVTLKKISDKKSRPFTLYVNQ